MDSRIELDRSLSKFTCTEAGICFSNWGIMRLMPSTTLTVLALGWRSTAITKPRSPMKDALVFTCS